jgi:hypothetical protein
LSPRFSQRPTLGEFIAVAKQRFGYALRRTVPIGGSFGKERLKYLFRKKDGKIIDLPFQADHARLSQNSFEALCQNAGIPEEDFRRKEDDEG